MRLRKAMKIHNYMQSVGTHVQLDVECSLVPRLFRRNEPGDEAMQSVGTHVQLHAECRYTCTTRCRV